MDILKKYFLTILLSFPLSAAIFTPQDESELFTAIQTANFNMDGTNFIQFPNGISLTELTFPLHTDENFDFYPNFFKTLNISGNGQNLSGNSSVQGFFIAGGTTTISNLNFANFNSIGGNGGSGSNFGYGGGAGPGLGGALFVASDAVVTLTNCTFNSCQSTGGNGTSTTQNAASGGGGGGLHGNGGDCLDACGGGGGGFAGNGGTGFFGGGGGGGFFGDGGNGGAVSGMALTVGEGGKAPYGGGGGGAGSTSLAGTGAGGAASFNNDGSPGSGVSGGSGGTDAAPFSSGGDGGNAMGMSGGGGGSGDSVNGGNATTDGGDGANAVTSGFGGGGGGGSNNLGGTGGNALTTGNGGGGGGGGFGTVGGDGGNGGAFAGGGGGGFLVGDGGTGGFAGGGGGGTLDFGDGARAGFGGGGGSGITAGLGGYGGGDGVTAEGAAGGGGAAFGGAIFIQEGGNLMIEGSLSFSSSTVTAGTGSSGGTADGIDIFMMSESQITFDITSDVILQNPIAGNQGRIDSVTTSPTTGGGLTKRGSALLSLTGENTYTGTTAVEEGELQINSSVITDITVDNGATLSGNFTINQDLNGNGGNLNNNGLFTPGVDGIGSVTVSGVYTNQPMGVLQVEITHVANASDKVFVTGSADLMGGQLEVFINPGNYIAGTEYEIIIGDVMGAFDNQDNPTQIGPFAGSLELEVLTGSLILRVLSNSFFLGQNIDPGPPQDVANCLENAVVAPGSDLAMVIELLGFLGDKQLNEALASLSAIRYGSLEWINARNNSYVTDILSKHMFELCCSPRQCGTCCCNGNLWASVFGNLMDQKKRIDFLDPFKADAVGGVVGVDFCTCCCFYYGAAFGYTHTDLDWKPDGGDGEINSYYGALYGSWLCNCWSIDLSILGGGSDNNTARKIEFSSLDRKAKADFWSYFVTAHLGGRGRYSFCCNILEPYALIDYHYYTRESFTEKGADSINLHVKSKDQHMIRGEAGLLCYCEINCDCFCWAPYLGLSWVGEFPLEKSKQPASFIGQSCIIDATSYEDDIQLASPQAGIKYTHCSGLSFLLGYKGLYNKEIRINEFEARLEWIF